MNEIIDSANGQPQIIGSIGDNEEKLIAGTLTGKFNMEKLKKDFPNNISKLNQDKIEEGVDGLSIRLIEYPDRARFSSNMARILGAPYGNKPEHEWTNKEIEEAWEKLSGFYSPGAAFQFGDVAFEISGVSRTFTHQLVRTRLASYMQQTTRVVYLGENYNVRMPFSIAQKREAKIIFEGLVNHARGAYAALCNLGIPLEDARYVSPVGVETYIIAKYPLNIFLSVYAQRACPMMEWQIVWVVRKMKELLIWAWPEFAKFIKVPCQFKKKCNAALAKEQNAKELCDFPWAGEI